VAGTPALAQPQGRSAAVRGDVGELRYRFELDLVSSPDRLWPLVSDTNRFNRDAGVPAVVERDRGPNARKRLRLTRLGVPVEWEEEPFEWISPYRFSVMRRYLRGPLEWMRVSATLSARESGGTHLAYDVRARPRNLLGRVAAAVQIGILSRRRFVDVFRRYDSEAGGVDAALRGPSPRLAPAARERLEAARKALRHGPADRLVDLLERGDELTVARLRPYALADAWGCDRRETLELCLEATRQGLLELQWELLCPLCRGAAANETRLDAVGERLHCDTCLIDFDVQFDRSVEVTFRPAAAIRETERAAFCVGGPQLTPHVVAQQLVPPGGRRSLDARLEPGRYRVRALALPHALPVVVMPGGADAAEAILGGDGWSADELRLGERPVLTLANETGDEQLLELERTAWSDQAATAAEVTALQVYRDLFAAEALRPGQPISVGTLAVVFTDLRGSTRYYREIGDAPAFGSVLTHLDQLREAVAGEGGAVVKSMGDAIMAVFPRPVAAVRAMRAAQERVAGKPLALKVGIHAGPCIAVSQNGVLDYFGSAVNLASRLVSLSSGDELVVSAAVLDDPEVAALGLEAQPLDREVKGFEGEEVALWRVRP
jgi:class 3 adenylate cyclase